MPSTPPPDVASDRPLPQPAAPLPGGELKPWIDAALADIAANVCRHEGQTYFGSGTDFGLMLYTRDIALSGVLSLNRLFPQIMAQSLRETRRVREEVGFLLSTARPAPQLPFPWQDSGLDDRSFRMRYRTNPFDRRTDDVVWLWAAGDLLRQDADCGIDWPWVLETGRHFFERFYDPMFDATDGLYRGQVLFFDIPFFPDKHTSGYPWTWPADEVLNARALSTNAVYCLGLQTMAEAATRCGEPAEPWQDRADQLREAIRTRFRRPDGTLSYLRSADGELQPHRDALGTALCIHAGIVAGDEARQLIDSYPEATYGVPLLDPFRPDNDWAYHNRSAWPFVDALFYWARDLAHGTNTAATAAQRLAETGYDGETFRELVRADTAEPAGSKAQLWSAAGFLNAALRVTPAA